MDWRLGKLVGGGAAIGGFTAVAAGFPVVAAGLGVVGLGAGVVQLADALKSTPEYGYMGKGYNDPRRLDATQSSAVLDRPYRTFAEDVADRQLAYQQSAIGQAIEESKLQSLNAAIEVGAFSRPSLAKVEAEQKAAAEKAAAEKAATEAAARALLEAFRASEIAYTNSSGGWRSSSNDFGGYNGMAANTNEDCGYGMGEHGGSLAPIVIDLDGNGIDLYLNGQSSSRFDVDDDGYSESTAWAGPQDGILVIDEGNDNQITQSKEIAFAKWTAADGDTDLEGLAATFDSNRDGVLDARDQRFADFKVWKDANSNGVADAGEMVTLQEAGIKSMETKVKDGTALDLDEGTHIAGLFKVQKTDGKFVEGADVSLSAASATLWASLPSNDCQYRRCA